jgi:hypothetical protein
MGRRSETVLNARRAVLFLIVCLAAREASAIQDGENSLHAVILTRSDVP